MNPGNLLSLLLVVGCLFMMMKRGGCCGGGHHSGSDSCHGDEKRSSGSVPKDSTHSHRGNPDDSSV
ncbi:MAG: hypothetical protein Q7I97_05140 [Thermovirgaceae bacterium]|nr:hypothetical protein [Thermovirgaceae bacterium]